MSKKFRLYALAAVALFAMFGVAWALGVSNHVIATTTDADNTANFDVTEDATHELVIAAYGKDENNHKTAAEFTSAFTIPGTAVTWSSMVRLPNSAFTRGVADNGTAPYAAGTGLEAISDIAAHGNLQGVATFGAAVGAANLPYDGYNDEYPDLNVIRLTEGQTFTIRPAGTAANHNFIGTATSTIAAWPANDNLGYLRIDGEGTTTIYAGNGNNPTNAVFNNYAGGTFLRGGTLRVAHTNSLGLGHVQVQEGATLDIFDADTSLSENSFGGEFPALSGAINQQRLILRRNLEAGDDVPVAGDTSDFARTPGEVFVNVGAAKTFEIRSMIGESVTVYNEWDSTNPGSGINARDILAYNATFPARLYIADNEPTRIRGARLVKTGAGTLFLSGHATPAPIDRDGTIRVGPINHATLSGAIHKGGTDIREGAVRVVVNTPDPYVAPFGFEYANRDGATPIVAARSPKRNFGPNQQYNNYLRIGDSASFTTNRDQFFGDFAGAETATFATAQWSASGNVSRNPQIVIQSNGAGAFAASPSEESSYFAGLITKSLDLIIDTGFSDQVIALGNDENTITSGDTTIADGVLSIAGANSVGPGTIRVGTPPPSATDQGYKDFVGRAIATLHADGTFAVDKPLITDSRGRRVAANLSANRGDKVSYSDVTVNGVAGGDLGETNLIINNDFSTNTPSIADGPYSHLAPRYMAGTVAFSDKYNFAGTLTNPTRVDIERGVLHLEKTPETGFALIHVFDATNNLANNGVLSFGKDANDFSKSLDLRTQDDSRIRVVLRASDLKNSLGDAQTSQAVLSVATFTNNLGRNADAHRENRLVFQIDVKEVGTLPGGKYVKLFEALDSTDWNSLHFTRDGSDGATEDLMKVDLAFIDTSKSDQESSLQRTQIEAFSGEYEDAIYLIIKDDINPDQPDNPGPTDPVTATPDLTKLTLTASVRDSSVANKEVTFTLTPVAGGTPIVLTATADAQGLAGPVTFTGLQKAQYRLTVTDPDGNAIGSARTFDFSSGGGSGNNSGGGSGCDAGFGVFGLLAAAGTATLISRKHD
jgi:hypothetical protein